MQGFFYANLDFKIKKLSKTKILVRKNLVITYFNKSRNFAHSFAALHLLITEISVSNKIYLLVA